MVDSFPYQTQIEYNTFAVQANGPQDFVKDFWTGVVVAAIIQATVVFRLSQR